MNGSYYNESYGEGFEGIINYANVLVDGWLVNFFLLVAFGISMYVLSKSEWDTGASISYSLFGCLLIAWIFKLFTTVNEYVIFIIIFLLGISVVVNIIKNK
jgi:hypothetical protein